MHRAVDLWPMLDVTNKTECTKTSDGPPRDGTYELTFFLGECRADVHMYGTQLRQLRDVITEALGGSPQSTSTIEAIQSLASVIRQTADQISEVISTPPIAAESER